MAIDKITNFFFKKSLSFILSLVFVFFVIFFGVGHYV